MGLGDLVELVRGPAALTVPGDTLAGGAAGPGPAAASVCLYWAGMALNDYADRDLDAVERPERPIPSGRVTPGQALALAVGLTGAGLVLAARARVLRTALPLTAAIWAYDVKLKDTPLGPATMAAARGLDVLLAGRPGARRAAAAVAAHTYGVTLLSRGEVVGGSASRSAGALAATGVAAVLGASAPAAAPARTGRTLVRWGLTAGYAALVGRAQVRAALRGDAAATRAAVGESILGILPLQAALTAREGPLYRAAVPVALYAPGRWLSRRVSAT
ncbi:SCO3242 family prenyltransferase [Actinomadura algeriensis]|nr:UbiA family prenyltransferase [Actinomadura algeriensis]